MSHRFSYLVLTLFCLGDLAYIVHFARSGAPELAMIQAAFFVATAWLLRDIVRMDRDQERR